RRNVDAVAVALDQPRLWIPGGDYPAHATWAQQALGELEAGQKRAMVAYWGKEVVGAVVYQRSKARSTELEIKNLSIEPYARGRHIADFLMKQVEIEGVHDFPGCTAIVADTKITNKGLLAFVSGIGYRVQGVTELQSMGQNGTADVLLRKDLLPSDRPLLI
ncbi:MAG: GNAT family N-acetyltransferase, partial [Candidatus Saccharimonadales bacterium]